MLHACLKLLDEINAHFKNRQVGETMYRIKMEVYFDMEGTNAEVVDAVRDFEMRNLVEFGDMNLVF